MKRGTTPTINIAVTGCDIGQFDNIYVTFRQYELTLEKSKNDLVVTDNGIAITLSQEETLSFKPGEVCIQIRASNESGNAIASDIQVIKADRILKEGVI